MNEAYVKVQRCPKAHTKIYSKNQQSFNCRKKAIKFPG